MSPSTTRRAWTVIAAAALLAAAISALVTCWIVSHYAMRIPLRDQSMQAALPPDLPVSVEVLRAQGVGPSGNSAEAAAADSQGVPVRLNETLQLQASFDAQVPLSMTVRYRGSIPVRAQVPLKTTISTRVLGVAMNLPVEGTIPLDLQLPVDLKIPVNQPVRLKFTAPVSARIDQVVHIPLRAQLDTRIRFTDATIPIVVRQADLEVPLADLSVAPVGNR